MPRGKPNKRYTGEFKRKRQTNPRYRIKKQPGIHIPADRSDICYDRMIMFGCHIGSFSLTGSCLIHARITKL